MFVGRKEKMEEDTQTLNQLLGVEMNHTTKIRENKSNTSKYQSPLAVPNLLQLYEQTEYKTLRVLLQYGWITQDTYDSYRHV